MFGSAHLAYGGWVGGGGIVMNILLLQPHCMIKVYLYDKKRGVSVMIRLMIIVVLIKDSDNLYIMPPMPPMLGIAAGAGFSSFLSAITHSVVRNIPATEAAFSKATRATLVGSMTPAVRRCS